MRVGVLGAGAWGTTVAALAAAAVPTRLWALEAEVVKGVREQRENAVFLPGHRLPAALHATNDIAEALEGADLVVVAVPSGHLRDVARLARECIPSQALVLSLAKGLETGTGKRMTEVLADVLDTHPPSAIGVLSGPNLAGELMAGQPSATCVAFPDLANAEAVQRLLMSDRLRVYTSSDVIGCEIGGAVKNVIAIAAGIADGLGFAMNTKAALLTRGLAELSRLGAAAGGDPLTFLGLSGIGDLIATCGSPRSRNHRVGEQLAAGRSVSDIVNDSRAVAEGIDTAPAVLALAGRLGVDMPICETVVAICSGQLAPSQALPSLMQRTPKRELEGLDGTGVPESGGAVGTDQTARPGGSEPPCAGPPQH